MAIFVEHLSSEVQKSRKSVVPIVEDGYFKWLTYQAGKSSRQSLPLNPNQGEITHPQSSSSSSELRERLESTDPGTGENQEGLVQLL